MSESLQTQNFKSKRSALLYLKQSCKNLQYQQLKKKKINKNPTTKNKVLQKLIKHIKIDHLKRYVTDNLLLNNIFNKRHDFQILSRPELDQMRTVQLQGFRIDQKILATIYILEIIFILVIFVLSAFVAFLQDFRNQNYGQKKTMLVLNIFAIVFSGLKIITTTVTKKIKDGILLIYISDIFMDYVKSLLIFIDIVYLIMIVLLIAVGNKIPGFGITLFFLCILKLITSFSNFVVFQTTFIKGFHTEQYWKLVKTIIFNLGFAHFVASMLLAMTRLNYQDNWFTAKQIEQEEWQIKYMWAYYWATTIMMTVGFGDFIATNYQQGMVLAFLQFFSCIVLAYNISEIGSVISSIRSSHNQYQKKVSIFKRMAEEDQIDVQLKTQIEGYLRQQRQIRQSYEFDEQSQLLGSIPKNLKDQYIVQSNRKFFKYIPFFRNIRKATLMKFTSSFQSKVYYPGEYLFYLNQLNDDIMILKQGKVGLTYKKSGSKLNGTIVQSIEIVQKEVYARDDIFKMKRIPIVINSGFLNRTSKMNYQIVAQTYSFVYTIPFEDFITSIKESQSDSSYYFSILHKTSITKKQWSQVQCDKCIKKNTSVNHLFSTKDLNKLGNQQQEETQYAQCHTKFQCPKLHFYPLKGVTILKAIKSYGKPQNRRQSYRRKKQRQSHCYLLSKKVYYPVEQKMGIKKKKFFQSAGFFESLRKISFMKKQSNTEFIMGPIPNQINEVFNLSNEDNFQRLQKLIKKSLREILQEYEEGWWDLEIDLMSNYLNYFPLQNAKNLDYQPLNQGKMKKMAHRKLDTQIEQVNQTFEQIHQGTQRTNYLPVRIKPKNEINILESQQNEQKIIGSDVKRDFTSQNRIYDKQENSDNNIAVLEFDDNEYQNEGVQRDNREENLTQNSIISSKSTHILKPKKVQADGGFASTKQIHYRQKKPYKKSSDSNARNNN